MIFELQDENQTLKDNWDKLKEYIRKTKLNEFEKSYGKRYSKNGFNNISSPSVSLLRS